MKKTLSVAMLAVFLTFFLCFAVSAEESVQNEAKVTDGNTVKVLYTLTVDGDVIDSSIDGEPLKFKVGESEVIPGFESAVKGMKVGEKKSFKLSPVDAYGEIDPDAYQEIPVSDLPAEIIPEAGMTLQAMNPEGQAILVVIKEVKNDAVVMDFNHPLAGKTLNFEIEIVEIL